MNILGSFRNIGGIAHYMGCVEKRGFIYVAFVSFLQWKHYVNFKSKI